MTSTHFEVPAAGKDRASCLGPDGSARAVIRVLALLEGRWKLPILFRLFGTPVLRFSELLHDIDGVSHKMLAQHLRELEADGLVLRTDHLEQPRRVDYRLSGRGEALRPVLLAMRDFGRQGLDGGG